MEICFAVVFGMTGIVSFLAARWSQSEKSGLDAEDRKKHARAFNLATIVAFAFCLGCIFVNLSASGDLPEKPFVESDGEWLEAPGGKIREICVNGFSYMLFLGDDGGSSLVQVFTPNRNGMNTFPKRCEPARK